MPYIRILFVFIILIYKNFTHMQLWQTFTKIAIGRYSYSITTIVYVIAQLQLVRQIGVVAVAMAQLFFGSSLSSSAICFFFSNNHLQIFAACKNGTSHSDVDQTVVQPGCDLITADMHGCLVGAGNMLHRITYYSLLI